MEAKNQEMKSNIDGDFNQFIESIANDFKNDSKRSELLKFKRKLKDSIKLKFGDEKIKVPSDRNELIKMICKIIDDVKVNENKIMREKVQNEHKNTALNKFDYSNDYMCNVLLNTLSRNYSTPIKFCEKLDEFVKKYGYDINYANKQIGTVLHYAVYMNSVPMVKYILKHYKDKLDLNKKYTTSLCKTPQTISEYCSIIGRYQMRELIRLCKFGLNLINKVKKYENDNLRVNNISKLFRNELFNSCSKNTEKYNEIMSLLESTTVSLINNGKIISNDLFKIVWDYNVKIYNNDITKMNLWNVLKSKMTGILDINTVSTNKLGWYWFRDNLLGSNLWLHPLNDEIENKDNVPILFDKLLNIVKQQLESQKIVLKNNMKELINENNESKLFWKKLCDLEYTNPKFKDSNSHRQDMIIHGTKSNFNDNEFKKTSIISSTDLYSLYDYNNYISSLIITGNLLNSSFQKEINKIFKDYKNTKKCVIKSAPVKTLERCQVKSELDYINCKFPTSSCIIDIIRCSISFNSLKEYYNAVLYFISYINNKNSKIITDIVRLKNGFNKLYTKHKSKNENGEFIPNSYCDVKLNIVISNGKQSIIGEIQFLIKPMLESKKKDHELYEIKRLDDMLRICSKNLKYINDVNNALKVNVALRNKNGICKLLISNNLTMDWNMIQRCLYQNRDLSIFSFFLKYLKKEINFATTDGRKQNVLHLIMCHSKPNNYQNNIKIFDTFIKYLLNKSKNENNNYKLLKSIINSKNNWNVTPFMCCSGSKYNERYNYEYLTHFLNLTKNIPNLFDFNEQRTNDYTIFEHLAFHDKSVNNTKQLLKLFNNQITYNFAHNKFILGAALKNKNDKSKSIYNYLKNTLTEEKNDNQITDKLGLDNKTFYISPSHVKNKCLDVQNALKSRNAKIFLWDFNGNKNQQFKFHLTMDGFYRIECIHSGLYLTVNKHNINVPRQNPNDIIQWDYYGSNNQLFKVCKIENKQLYYIKIKQNNKVFEIDKKSDKNLAKLVQNDYSGENHQLFVFKLVN